MMKKFTLSVFVFFSSLIICAGEYLIAPAAFSSFYAKGAKYANGVFEGTPDNGGASLVAKIGKDFPAKIKFSRFVAEISGCKAKQLALSLRGKTNLQIAARPGNKADEFIFDLPEIPENLKQIRIYYNLKNAAGGKPVKFTLKKAAFVMPDAQDADKFSLHPDAFTAYHASKVKFADGVFEGTPGDGGASLVARIKDFPKGKKFNRAILLISGVKAPQLALSLRGKNNIQLKAVPGGQPDEFFFFIDQIPEDLKQIRIYYNLKNAAGGKPVKFTLKSLVFVSSPEKKKESDSPGKMISALPMPKRQRISEQIRIFPRIQSKYDLIKNYLGGYSLGNGLFFDRPLFFDRTLAENPQPPYNKLNTPKSFRRQLHSVREFGDGFAIFIGARKERFTMPLAYVRNTGMMNAILVESPPVRLKNFDMSCEQIDLALETPETFKINGSLILGSYHGHVLSPAEWKELLAPYRKRYGDKVKFMCELRLLCYALNKEYNLNGGKVSEKYLEKSRNTLREYLRVVDGINFSGSNHLTISKPGFPAYAFNADAYEKIIVPLVAGVLAEPEFDGKKLLGLSAHKVYSMVINHKSNVDEEGTAGLRRSFAAAVAANPDYIVMPEWNEINENTHVEPTVSDARTNQRVINALVGKEVAAKDHSIPNFILSFRQDNDLAAPIPVELLGLPDSKAAAYSVTLKLFAPDGRTLLKEFPQANFNHREIQPEFFMIPAREFAAHRFLIPELTVKQGDSTRVIRRGLPVIRLEAAPNPYHRYVKIPLRDLPYKSRISAEFSLKNGQICVKGRAETASPMVTVELLANDIPIAAVDPKNEFAPPPGMILLCWRRNAPLTSGFNEDQMRMTALKGSIMSRQPGQYGLAAMVPPVQKGNTLEGAIGAGSSVREFLFYATPDAVLEIAERGQSATVKVSDVIRSGVFRKSNSHGVSWKLFVPQTVVEVPFPLERTSVDFDLAAPVSALHNPVYILRVITRDGEVYRSEPFYIPASGKTENALLPVWDIADQSRKTVEVPQNLLRKVDYVFNPEYGDLLMAGSGGEYFAGVIGGFDYRLMFAKGWDAMKSPKWRQENGRWVLDFVPGCGVIIPPPVFSGSAFSLDMEFSLNNITAHTLIDTIGHSMLVKVSSGKLHGVLITGKGKYPWQAENFTFESGKYYRLQINYDLARFSLRINGREVVSFPAAGTMPQSYVLGIGGAPLLQKKPVVNIFVKAPEASDVPDSGFNFNGSLRALSIRNW